MGNMGCMPEATKFKVKYPKIWDFLFSQIVMARWNFFANRNGEKENSRIYFPKQKWPDIRFETFYFRKQ